MNGLRVALPRTYIGSLQVPLCATSSDLFPSSRGCGSCADSSPSALGSDTCFDIEHLGERDVAEALGYHGVRRRYNRSSLLMIGPVYRHDHKRVQQRRLPFLHVRSSD
jgi:hypothetical protein